MIQIGFYSPHDEAAYALFLEMITKDIGCEVSLIATEYNYLPSDFVASLKNSSAFAHYKELYDISCNIEANDSSSSVIVNGKSILYQSNSTPQGSSWGNFGVKVVINCNTNYWSSESANAFILGGAGKVILQCKEPISPKSNDDIPFITQENVSRLSSLIQSYNIIYSCGDVTSPLSTIASAINEYNAIDALILDLVRPVKIRPVNSGTNELIKAYDIAFIDDTFKNGTLIKNNQNNMYGKYLGRIVPPLNGRCMDGSVVYSKNNKYDFAIITIHTSSALSKSDVESALKNKINNTSDRNILYVNGSTFNDKWNNHINVPAAVDVDSIFVDSANKVIVIPMIYSSVWCTMKSTLAILGNM